VDGYGDVSVDIRQGALYRSTWSSGILPRVFRASFRLTERLRDAGDWGRLLRDAAPAGVLVVAGFLDAKTVEAYLDVDPGTDVHTVTDVLAQRLGFDEYEVTAVEWLRIPPSQSPSPEATEPRVPTTPPPAAPEQEPAPVHAATAPVAAQASPTVSAHGSLLRVHPGTITQVAVKPDGYTLSVKVRHRRNEAIAGVAVEETTETITLAASIGIPEHDRRADFASFGVTFSWADADLAREVGARRIIYTDDGIHTAPGEASGAGVGAVIGETPAVEDSRSETEPEGPQRPEAREHPMSDATSRPARDAQGRSRPKRPPIMLMLLVAFAVALFLRRTRHR